MGEDMVITLPALLDAQRIVVMEGAAWYHYLFLRESMVHSYDAGMYENIRSLDKIVRQILADKHAPNAQKQADRELQLLMFLEIKNEARNGREGWKGRLQKECRETELQEAVKRMPLTPTVTENKLMYQMCIRDRELPGMLDMEIGERGVRLSGGQRQRLGIARALYHNPEILVFDEATSALDTDTETAIMEAIESFHGKKTLVIIAHRLRTIAGCDIIYKVDNGKIVETTLTAEEH